MYHNVFRYEYLTFQTQIHLHKQYIFDTNIIQSEYAFLFPFSIYTQTAGILAYTTTLQFSPHPPKIITTSNKRRFLLFVVNIYHEKISCLQIFQLLL